MPNNKPLKTKICKMCGAKFKAKLPYAKFCATPCRMRWHRIHKRWRAWKETEEGQAYYAMSCDQREALEREQLKAYDV